MIRMPATFHLCDLDQLSAHVHADGRAELRLTDRHDTAMVMTFSSGLGLLNKLAVCRRALEHAIDRQEHEATARRAAEIK